MKESEKTMISEKIKNILTEKGNLTDHQLYEIEKNLHEYYNQCKVDIEKKYNDLLKEKDEKNKVIDQKLNETNEALNKTLLQLSESESKYLELLNNINSGVAVYRINETCNDFVIKDINKSVEKIENVRRGEIVGKLITEVFKGVKEFGLLDILHRVHNTGKAETFPVSLYQDDGHKGWREGVIYKIPSGDIIAVYEDVTEKKNNEEREKEYTRKLKEKNEEYEAINEKLSRSNERIKSINERIRVNEAYLNSIFKAAPVGIGVVVNRSFQFVNNVICTMTGYSEQELIGQNARMLYPSDEDYEYVGKEKYDQIQKKGVGTVETRWCCKDGQIKDIILSSSPIDKEDWAKGITFTALDHTETKKALSDLNHIFNLSADMICIASLDGYFIKINPAFKKILGYEEEELLNRSFFDFIHPDDIQSTKDVLEEKLRKEILVINFENRYRCKNGTYKWLSWVSQPRLEKFMTFAIARDVTAQKQYQKEIIKAKEKAEESDRLKSAFLANMSHEIRTPMNGILGFVNLLQSDDVDQEKRKHYIKIINNSANQLLAIISDIIDISKIEAGQLKIENKEFSLNELMDEVYLQFSNELKEKGKENVELKLKKGLQRCYVITDDVRLKQVFYNLISNAIKFTNEGYIEFGYKVKENNSFLFYVKDTGIGIPGEKLQLIFERFRQVDDAHTRKHSGTGLGLTICKGIMELLEGKIWLESEVGKGSTFYFTLPLIIREIKDESMSDQFQKVEGQYDWGHYKVLIVDDIEIIYEYLRDVLEPTGIDISYVKTGKEAVGFCRENQDIDIVLMDIQLPDINGYEATREIRKFNKNIKVMAQTAYAMADDRKKSIESGCNDYISKPINRVELLKKMGNLFEKRS